MKKLSLSFFLKSSITFLDAYRSIETARLDCSKTADSFEDNKSTRGSSLLPLAQRSIQMMLFFKSAIPSVLPVPVLRTQNLGLIPFQT